MLVLVAGAFLPDQHIVDCRRQAGTLIYPLAELGVPITLSAFVQIIEHGSFEARSMALNLVEQERLDIEEGASLDLAVQHLRGVAGRESDPEAAEAAKVALDLLSLLRGSANS